MSGIIILCVYVFAHAIPEISALLIAPPSSLGDYRQLASLLADTFDFPTSDFATKSITNNLQQQLGFKIDALWNTFERALTEDYTCQKYTATARRMRGKKYCVLLAKELIQGDNDNQQIRVRDEALGMVEMGMSLCPIFSNDLDNLADPTTPIFQQAIKTESRPQPTVGVLCVKSSHRKKGIGQALIQKCEQVAADIWNEEFLFVDVEPSNEKTLLLFEKWGYVRVGKRNAAVSRRRLEQPRPHYLLRKRLII